MRYNIGLKNCSYEYVARMDSDDIMKPTRLEVQYKYMIDHPEVDVSSTDMYYTSFTGGFWKEYAQEDCKHPKVITKEYAKTHDWILNHPCVMYKKSKVLKVGGYSENMLDKAEDYDLWIKMLKKNMVLHNIDEKLMVFRYSDNSLSRKINNELNQAHIKKLQNSL